MLPNLITPPFHDLQFIQNPPKNNRFENCYPQNISSLNHLNILQKLQESQRQSHFVSQYQESQLISTLGSNNSCLQKQQQQDQSSLNIWEGQQQGYNNDKFQLDLNQYQTCENKSEVQEMKKLFNHQFMLNIEQQKQQFEMIQEQSVEQIQKYLIQQCNFILEQSKQQKDFQKNPNYAVQQFINNKEKAHNQFNQTQYLINQNQQFEQFQKFSHNNFSNLEIDQCPDKNKKAVFLLENILKKQQQIQSQTQIQDQNQNQECSQQNNKQNEMLLSQPQLNLNKAKKTSIIIPPTIPLQQQKQQKNSYQYFKENNKELQQKEWRQEEFKVKQENTNSKEESESLENISKKVKYDENSSTQCNTSVNMNASNVMNSNITKSQQENNLINNNTNKNLKKQEQTTDFQQKIQEKDQEQDVNQNDKEDCNDECGSAFQSKTKKQLIRFRNNSSKKFYENLTEKDLILCPFDGCSYKSPIKYNVNKHIKRVHQTTIIHCQFCDYTCRYSYNLNRHIKNMHPGQYQKIKNDQQQQQQGQQIFDQQHQQYKIKSNLKEEKQQKKLEDSFQTQNQELNLQQQSDFTQQIYKTFNNNNEYNNCGNLAFSTNFNIVNRKNNNNNNSDVNNNIK